MDLSIVIVNYNVRDLLVGAIESVKAAMEGLDGEIIVVDNASTDGAVALLRAEYPEVQTIQLDRNIGFGGANNRGIEVARGEYILLLNPDTLVEEETLRVMLRFMRDHPEAGLATSKIYRPDGTLEPAALRGIPSPWSAFSRISGLSRLFPRSRLFGGYDQSWRNPEESHQVEAISGCFMFFRGDLLRELGGFDEAFFMYGEDLDLCKRTGLAGAEIWYYPETSIVHIKGQSTSRSSLDSIRMFYDAMEIFARKHHHRNPFMLPMLRAGIQLRMGVARFNRRFTAAGFAMVDLLAVLIGLVIGSLLRTGAVSFPESTMPWVFLGSPIPFLLAIGLAGGYGSDHERLSRVLLGYLGGFFILSTLPYFFEAYRFSRGIVLATTGIGAAIGLSVRFFVLLYQRTFGSGSARRVALLGSALPNREQRNVARRIFLGRPAKVLGLIAPRFTDLDDLGEEGLGTIENIAHIVEELRLTDIVVADRTMGYSQVIAGIRNASGTPVRFHLLQETGEVLERLVRLEGGVAKGWESYRSGPSISKRLWEKGLALAALPVVLLLRLLGRLQSVTAGDLFSVLFGGRPFIGGGGAPDSDGRNPVVSAAGLYGSESLLSDEIDEIERYYLSNRTFLLDCEILVASLREEVVRLRRDVVDGATRNDTKQKISG